MLDLRHAGEDADHMTRSFSVLDGAPHTGTVLDLSPCVREWMSADGATYRDTGHLHAHEQHEWVRWFRRVDLPSIEAEHP